MSKCTCHQKGTFQHGTLTTTKNNFEITIHNVPHWKCDCGGRWVDLKTNLSEIIEKAYLEQRSELYFDQIID